MWCVGCECVGVGGEGAEHFVVVVFNGGGSWRMGVEVRLDALLKDAMR